MPGMTVGLLVATFLWLGPLEPGSPQGTRIRVSAGPVRCLADRSVVIGPDWHDTPALPSVVRHAVQRLGPGAAPVDDAPDQASSTCGVAPLPDDPLPAYPALLRSARVEGRVVVQFVVDTVGHVVPASIGIEKSTHALFSTAVRNALLRSHYRPAEVGGRRMRQWVAQRFTFTLRP